MVCATPVTPVMARRRRRVRRRRQGDVALSGEQPRRRVHADPAGPRDVHLGPGVQIGEVGRRTGRTVQRRRRRRSAAPGSRRRTGRPGPARAAARPAARPSPGRTRSRCSACGRGSAHPAPSARNSRRIAAPRRSAAPGSRRSGVPAATEKSLSQPVTSGPGPLPGSPSSTGRRYGFRSSARSVGYSNPKCSAYSSMKKSKGLTTVRSATRPTVMVSSVRPLREDQARHEIAERVLLPVHEVVGRLDGQRVRLDLGP